MVLGVVVPVRCASRTIIGWSWRVGFRVRPLCPKLVDGRVLSSATTITRIKLLVKALHSWAPCDILVLEVIVQCVVLALALWHREDKELQSHRWDKQKTTVEAH